MGLHLVQIIIGTGLALVGASAFADTAPSAPLTAAQPEPNHAYLRDHAGTLSRSDDAHALLTAALLDDIVGTPTGQRFAELLARAEQAAPNDPLVWWIAAMQCRGQANACADAQRDARAKLVVIDPDNAVTWLLEATAAQQAGDSAGAAHAFKNAAAAPRYDDHMMSIKKMLLAQFIAHPHLAAIATGTQDEDAYVRAASIAATLMPPMQVSFGVCTPNHKPVQDAATVEQCLKLATTMQHGDSLLAVSIGLRIEQRLLEGKPEAVSAERRRRSLAWMLQQTARFGAATDGDSESARRYRSILYRSNSELEGSAALMTELGIPLDPSADWHDPGHY